MFVQIFLKNLGLGVNVGMAINFYTHSMLFLTFICIVFSYQATLAVIDLALMLYCTFTAKCDIKLLLIIAR